MVQQFTGLRKSLSSLFSCSIFILVSDALLNQQLEELIFTYCCAIYVKIREKFAFVYLI